MKNLLAVIAAVLLVATAASVHAEVRTEMICNGKALSGSGANLYGLGNGITDCTYTDISQFAWFSWQAICTDAGDSAVSVSFDWIAGKDAVAANMAIPLTTAGAAMSQLKTGLTAETLTAIQSLQPTLSPVGTIRLTNGEADTDVTCTVYLHMGR